jgi:hypothetical protein
MSTEVRRVAIVLARHEAVPPPGVDPATYARACLADSYEVLADLEGVHAGIAGTPEQQELLWPGGLALAHWAQLPDLARAVVPAAAEVVFVPADVPDLPGLVVAKVFQALGHVPVCVAPQRNSGPGCVAVGVRMPWPGWLSASLDLDTLDAAALRHQAPSPGMRVVPGWHRMRTPDAVHRLDPRLEGWEMTRAVLSGIPLDPA